MFRHCPIFDFRRSLPNRDAVNNASRDGTFRTTLDIGARVEAGQTIAHVGDSPIKAPMTGVLRGIVHHEVVVEVGTKLIEVDPRHESQCFGLGERPRAIAAGVLRAIERIATM
jgi:xanthine dehydrogenase accessory factor